MLPTAQSLGSTSLLPRFSPSDLIQLQGSQYHLHAEIFIFSSNFSSQFHTHIANYLLQTKLHITSPEPNSLLYFYAWSSSKAGNCLTAWGWPATSGGASEPLQYEYPLSDVVLLTEVLGLKSTDCTHCNSFPSPLPFPLQLVEIHQLFACTYYPFLVCSTNAVDVSFLIQSTCHSMRIWEGRTWCCARLLTQVFPIVGSMLPCPCGSKSLQQTYFRPSFFYLFQISLSSTVTKILILALKSLYFGTDNHRNNGSSHRMAFSAVIHYI